METPKLPENAGEGSKNATTDPEDEEEGEIQEDKTALPSTTPSAPVASTSSQPFKKASRHRTLVLNGSTNAAAPTQSGSTASKAGREVVINGVTFISDASGKKLSRKDCAAILPLVKASGQGCGAGL